MDVENIWDYNWKEDTVEGPVSCTSRDEVVQALNETKTGEALELQMYRWS